MLNSIITTTDAGNISTVSFLFCTLASLILGMVCAFVYMFKNNCSRSFVTALALLPAIVQVVIMLVNGNIGAGVAVMGAFSLIRFRSVPGNARDIVSIFCAMAIGLATGMGYIWLAAALTAVIGVMSILLTLTGFGAAGKRMKELRITIPESSDYTDLFDDLFEKYTDSAELIRVKTTNMGSMFQLLYRVRIKNPADEKKFIDEIRCRNGNLTVICGYSAEPGEEL